MSRTTDDEFEKKVCKVKLVLDSGKIRNKTEMKLTHFDWPIIYVGLTLKSHD